MKLNTPGAAATGPAQTCRHCGRPLDALAQRRGLARCGAAACRQGADDQVLKARWQQVAARAVQQGQALLAETPAPAPVVLWLSPVERALEPVSPALREALAASWRQRAEEGWRHAYPGKDSSAAMPAAATVLCAECGGRCCGHGGRYAAFIDIDVLQRWQDDHPGASLEDAVNDYLLRLPAMHVKGGCAFHGATGCVLPRERRADVCNRYACDALLELADVLRQTPARAAVALTADGRTLERAAWLQHGRITAITGLPQPDQLPPPAG